MKRLALLMALMMCLTGCGFLRQTSYVVVEPHNENYEVAIDSNTITVNSYLSLKNAILNLVEDGVEEGVIRAESYSGNLAEDLSQAVYEVSKGTPLGAFAVDYMTYDYSRIVSYYEIHINTTFRRTAEEIKSVTYVTNLDALRTKLREAMSDYEPKLLLRVGDYEDFDLEAEVEAIYHDHPEFALELPDTSMELYPDSGTQRILEIKFNYFHSASQLSEARDNLAKQLKQLALIYGSSNSDITNAKRFYNRLGRDAVSVTGQEGTHTLTDSAYGVLVKNCATSYGFAQAYCLLMNAIDIDCQIITGQKNGYEHSWCLVKIDDAYYYVDPSMSAGGNSTDYFLMGTEELTEGGYTMWNAADMPAVELPEYLKPPAASGE